MPNEIQTSVAHAAIDAGADLFLGHHPHVLQPVELYEGKPILYSLGNFLFVSPSPLAQPTVIVRARLSKGGVRRLDLDAHRRELAGARARPRRRSRRRRGRHSTAWASSTPGPTSCVSARSARLEGRPAGKLG